MMIEIKKLKLAEEKLFQSEEKFRAIFEGSSDAIMLLDETRYFDCNNTTLNVFLFSNKKEFINLHPWQLSPPYQPDGTDSITAAINKIAEAFKSGHNRFEWVHRRENGEIFNAEVIMTAFDLKGRKVLQATVRDIDKRKKIEQDLEISEHKYRTLIENIQDGIFIIQDEKMQFVNESFARMVGYNVNDIIGKHFKEFVAPEYLQMVVDHYVRRQKGESVPSNYEFRMIHRNGTRILVNINAGIINYNDRKASTGTVKDIGESKRAEEKLKAHDEFTKLVIDSFVHTLLVINVNDHTIQLGNSAVAGNWEGKTCYAISHHNTKPCESKEHPCPIEEVKRTKKPVIVEHIHHDKDGNLRNVEVHCFPIFNPEGNVYRVIEYSVDITERKRSEEKLFESEERYRRLVESAPFGIAIHSDNRFVFVNPAAMKMLGASRTEELLGISIFDVLLPEFHDLVRERIKKQEKSEIAPLIEEKFVRLDGTIIDVELMSIPFVYNGKLAMYGVFQEITDRKKAQEDILMLLREIHHRVKNNMQIISSLLNLQSGYVEDEKERDIFKDCKTRILSMALIHENLYKSKDFTKIELNEYIKELASNLFQTYNTSDGKIELNVNANNVSMGINSATLCGLMINELVSNSLKHAFPDGREGQINIILQRKDDNMFELIVSDNGIGIPADLDFKNTDSLGLFLVKMLAEDQLEGEMNLDRSKGTKFSIRFKGVY